MEKNQVAARTAVFLELARVDSCVTAAFYTLVGAYLSSGFTHLFTAPVLRAALLVALLVAFGFVINDYKDVVADGFGKPYRPIPSGRISRRAAGLTAVALAGAALALAAGMGPNITALTLACMVLSVAYSYKLKETLLVGNITVAGLNATILFYGAFAAGGINYAVWMGSVLIFLYMLAQEVLYTVEDAEGDRRANARTTATRLGVMRTIRLFQCLALVFIAAAMLPWFLGLTRNIYLYAAVPCTIAPTLGIVVLLGFASTERALKFAIQATWYVWFSSLIPMALLR